MVIWVYIYRSLSSTSLSISFTQPLSNFRLVSSSITIKIGWAGLISRVCCQLAILIRLTPDLMGSIARARSSLHSLAYCLSPVLTSAVRGCSPNLASSADPSVAAIKQNTTQIAQQQRRRGQPQSSPHNSTPFAAAAFHLIAVDFWGFDRRRDGRQTVRERWETGDWRAGRHHIGSEWIAAPAGARTHLATKCQSSIKVICFNAPATDFTLL